MKAITLFLGLILYSLTSFSFAADGKMPGDNLDLNAVLDLFKNSKNIEDFEKKLNSEKTNINNLDLNEDGYVDYIRVVDYVKDNAHLITLQVAFTADEIQDVAVIELDKRDDKTVVQIVGNETVYGRDFIVEPATENEKMAYNANNWTSVQYIYGPQYIVYVSPWYYGFYPYWHQPWRPYGWDVYYGYVYPYHSHYRHCGYYRSYHAHQYYYGHKSYSPTYYKSSKNLTAQQNLPVNKKAMNEGNLKNTQLQKVEGKTSVPQRDVRKVDAIPQSENTIRTNTHQTNEPVIRTQPTTRSQQPNRSTSSPTVRSTPQRSPQQVTPQRGTVTRQPAPSRAPSTQPNRVTPSTRTPAVGRRP